MIRIYPSRLPGEPLETHHHGTTTLGAWLTANVDGYRADLEQPISIDVDGQPVHPHQWYCCAINAESDVRVYPVPMGLGAAAIAVYAALAIAAVALVYALTLSTDTPGGPQDGSQIDLNAAKANGVKLGQPVRQLLGQGRVYPDYVVQPVSRFVDKRKMETGMFLCIGEGRYSMPASSVKIGDTPLAAFGVDASYTLYEPGESVAADRRADNWYVVGEVGGTDAGTAGLNTNSTAPGGSAVIADALVLAGLSVALAGEETEIPEIWDTGTIVVIVAPNNFTVTEVGGYSRIAGPLDDLAPFVGMNVTLGAGNEEYALVVASYAPYVAPTPGIGGEPSSVLASSAPATYDFSVDAETWLVSFQGVDRTISLAADYINMSGLVSEITAQLNGSGLVAQDNSGRLRIVEPASPYQGGTLSMSSAPVAVFGIGPTYVVGTASSGGTPEAQAFLTLEYPDGEPFGGLPEGSQRLALGYRGNQYRITDIDGLTVSIERLTDIAIPDAGWAGFNARTVLDFVMASDAVGENWLGPFMATPEGELTTVVEYDTYFPAGLVRFNDKGRVRQAWANVIVQWRDAEIGGAWTEVRNEYSDYTPDSIGFTESITLPYAMRPQFRLRRESPEVGGQTRDTIHWYGLRAKLTERPEAYDGVTTIGVTVRTGDRLGAQSDRKINMVPTRLYDAAPARSITGAAGVVMESLGIGADQIDSEQLQALEETFWTPRGEHFDYAFTERSTARDVLQMIFNAGMGHLVLSGGLISAVREGVQTPKGMITPHEMTEQLSVGFVVPGPDDFTGVDVEYTSSATWATETIQCRLPGVEALKVETYKLDGVTSETRAWRIGMRRLRKHLGQRLSFECSTEMDARCYEYLDHVVLADDIPGTTQSALILDAEYEDGLALLTVSEPFNWDIPAPRCMIRRHDGTVTPVATPTKLSEYVLAVPQSLIDFDLITDLSIEPARLLLADSTRVGYAALIQSIEPGTDGATKLNAVEYSNEYYVDDDNYAPA